MAMPATQIRRGMVILFNGEPHRVIEFHHHTPGNLRAMVQTKMRNLKTGSAVEHRFRAADTVERAALSTHELQYLYSDGHHYNFMNNENFEQIPVAADKVGDASKYLKENDTCELVLYGEEVIGVELPASVELTVVETDPGFKGDTATGGTKPAVMETGLVVNVPLFIEQGAKIKVNTDSGSYIERVG